MLPWLHQQDYLLIHTFIHVIDDIYIAITHLLLVQYYISIVSNHAYTKRKCCAISTKAFNRYYLKCAN